MTILLVALGAAVVVLLLSVAVLVYAARTAEDGFEDATGFHRNSKPPRSRVPRRAGDSIEAQQPGRDPQVGVR